MTLLLLTAWLVAGCVVAWIIGKSSDLGKPSEAWRYIPDRPSQHNVVRLAPVRRIMIAARDSAPLNVPESGQG